MRTYVSTNVPWCVADAGADDACAGGYVKNGRALFPQGDYSDVSALLLEPGQDDRSSEEEDDDNSGPSAVGVQPKASRKSSAAGLQTPGSGRSNRNKTRARQSP